MIKRYISFLLVLVSMQFAAQATVHVVTVANFTFTPNIMTVDVGDTIHFMWLSGSHTTTSVSVPAGALTWNSPMSSSVPTFDYVPLVPGDYDYVCSPHASMGMVGTFTAQSGVGLNEVTKPVLNLNSSVTDGILNFSFQTSQTSQVRALVYDLTGKAVVTQPRELQPAGIREYQLNLQALPKGYYILKLESGNDQFAKRFLLN